MAICWFLTALFPCRDASFWQPKPWKPGSWAFTCWIQVISYWFVVRLVLCLLCGWAVTWCVHSEKSSSDCSTRIKCWGCSRRNSSRRRFPPCRPSWKKQIRLTVNWKPRTGEQFLYSSGDFILNKSLLLLYLPLLAQSVDWAESESVSCSSRLKISRRLCRFRQSNRTM